ncbi:hypothetical protein GCM10007049_11040 [Echinicola pacifica]|uniref:DoxX protein n=1 Tax=Echinicola pacifica TaxID=346377 RepID=A0A918PRI7_9BACT|nr:DoxX family protein [Echinicola pacifica]GGZ20262.1 hypothetical protein GCM10007049_11040 [Echinicola pacifica]
MKPLIVLFISFFLALLIIKWLTRQFDIFLAARIAMASMLIFTSIGHFVFSKGMAMMIPPVVPFKESLVFLTGILEILLAIGLLIPKLQFLSAWALIVFLVMMLPANIYASLYEVNFEKGNYSGNGPSYLLFRIPLQGLFIFWTYWSSIRN